MSYAIVYSSRTGNTALLAQAIRDTLPETVEADLRGNNAYWDQFRDNIVEKVSDTVYDAALKSYGDANGMRSYSMVVELLVAYYRNIV